MFTYKKHEKKKKKPQVDSIQYEWRKKSHEALPLDKELQALKSYLEWGNLPSSGMNPWTGCLTPWSVLNTHT